MNWLAGLFAFFGLGSATAHSPPPEPPRAFVVAQSEVADEKSVFATVESTNVVPARARIGGTVVELKIRQGDRVARGEVLAIVADQKLAIQLDAFMAQSKSADDQLAAAMLEFDRAQHLVGTGVVSKSQLDQARAAYDAAANNAKSIAAQEGVVQQQVSEGRVLAPIAGRIIAVPVTSGSVLMPGETVATVAEQNFVLRLSIPERHAAFLKLGDPVRVDGGQLGFAGVRFGQISLIYPDIRDGRVTADATLAGLEDYFVGERVLAWVSAGARRTIVVPSNLIVTRYGMDYARVWTAQDGTIDVPVERGQTVRRPHAPDELEILSGLTPGDRLLHP